MNSAPLKPVQSLSNIRSGPVRYAGGGSGLRSSTQCQKCLGYGHWTYECKSKERAYVYRESRTKQLGKPKKERVAAFPPEEALLPHERDGLADQILKKKRKERRSKRTSSSDDESSSSSSSSSSSQSSSTQSSSTQSSNHSLQRRKQRHKKLQKTIHH